MDLDGTGFIDGLPALYLRWWLVHRRVADRGRRRRRRGGRSVQAAHLRLRLWLQNLVGYLDGEPARGGRRGAGLREVPGRSGPGREDAILNGVDKKASLTGLVATGGRLNLPGCSPAWRAATCGRWPPARLSVSLVPAYNQCTSPNRVHGPPNLPGGGTPTGRAHRRVSGRRSSRSATPDANGAAANSVGSVRLRTIVGIPSAPDDADVSLSVNITDVRARPAGAAGLLGAARGAHVNPLDGPQKRARCERGRHGYGRAVPVRRALHHDRQYDHRVDMLGLDDRGCDLMTWDRRRRCADGVGARPGGARRRWGGRLAATEPNTIVAVQGVFVP